MLGNGLGNTLSCGLPELLSANRSVRQQRGEMPFAAQGGARLGVVSQSSLAPTSLDASPAPETAYFIFIV